MNLPIAKPNPMNAESAADVDAFVSSLGLSVRATNILYQLGVKSVTQLVALDNQTLMRRRNCGKKIAKEIMEVITRSMSSPETAAAKQADTASLAAALDRIPVSGLRLSVRAIGALERLNISTAGQLARVSDGQLLSLKNIGKTSLRELRSRSELLRSRLVLWPVNDLPADGLSPHVTRAARKLRRLRNASGLRRDDPRFGHIIQEIGLEAKNAREVATLILSRNADPLAPRVLMQRLAELIEATKVAGRKSLEAELWSLTDGLGSERNRKIIVCHLGWDGKPARTLDAVGQAYGMTRERVRQICTRIEAVLPSRPFLPMLDRALKTAAHDLPALAEEIERDMIQHGLTISGFCVEALATAARQFGRDPGFAIEVLHNSRVVVPAKSSGLLTRIDQFARGATSHWGMATVEDVAAAAGATITLAQNILSLLPGFRWLDESSGWFWIANTPRNSLLTQIRKILAASTSIDVGELRTGVGRHHRKKGFAPPRRVLLELCRQLNWCRVEGEKITVATPLIPSEILSDTELIILKVLKEHGPVMQRAKFERLCIDAGMNSHSFWVFLSYCPLVCRHATGVYGLRGAEVPVGLVENLVPKRTRKSKLLVDYGWTNDRNIQVLYRVSVSLLSSGIVSVPAALKSFVQGNFALMTGDNSRVGTLVVKDNSAWGLGPFFHRRGGEPGDYLLMVFHLSEREVVAQLGDSSLTDQLDSAESSKSSDEPELLDSRPLATRAPN